MRIVFFVMAAALSGADASIQSTQLPDVPAGTCGPDALPRQAPFAVLSGDACRAACDATNWSRVCVPQCCPAGTPFPPPSWDRCDPRCQAHCEHDRWGDCYYTWCNADVLFCESVPRSVDDLPACLDYLCREGVPVDNHPCR
jgi:hypothetical protein